MKTCEVEACDNEAIRDICRPHQLDVRYRRLEPMPHWKTKPNPECEVEGCGRAAQSKRVAKCKLHRDYEREGRDLETVRPKMRNGSQSGECAWCDRPSRARGLCDLHYRRFMNPPKMGACSREGCEKRTERDYCYQHTKHPRVVREGGCVVPGCKNRYRSYVANVCKTHRATAGRMGLAVDEFLEIKTGQSCGACGSEERLHVDHLHAHHPGEKRDRMCRECIRGVLCSNCNTALGLLGESPKKIIGLLNYLQNTPPGSFFRVGSSGLKMGEAEIIHLRAA